MKNFKWVCLCSLITILAGSGNGYTTDEKILYVGKELFEETLPLKNGAGVYRLQGLTPPLWYEVKISYPASIPSSFSLQLKRVPLDLGLNHGRKLLNTEKLIFKADEAHSKGGMYVAVNVQPEGVVALPGKHEREYVIFNIVCDELLLGVIPRKNWYVLAVAVVFCLVLAFVIVPPFLPPSLLPKNGNTSPILKNS